MNKECGERRIIKKWVQGMTTYIIDDIRIHNIRNKYKISEEKNTLLVHEIYNRTLTTNLTDR